MPKRRAALVAEPEQEALVAPPAEGPSFADWWAALLDGQTLRLRLAEYEAFSTADLSDVDERWDVADVRQAYRKGQIVVEDR